MQPDPREIACRIRAERMRLGLGMTEVATELGVAKQTYAELEAYANPRLSRLLELYAIGYDLRRIVPELGRRSRSRSGVRTSAASGGSS